MADQTLLRQVLSMIMGVINPATLAEATRVLTENRENPVFLEYLAEVYSGSTLDVPAAHVLDVRRIAGATLKASLLRVIYSMDGAGLQRVQARILTTLPDPALAGVSATLVSTLCKELNLLAQDQYESSPEGLPEPTLESLWPGLAGALVGVMEGAARGGGAGGLAAARGAILAIKQLAEDGCLYEGSTPTPATPAAHFLPRLLQWMTCSDGEVRLAAAQAGQAILYEVPEAAEPCLPAYLSTLAALHTAASAHPPSAPATTTVILHTFDNLVTGLPQAMWPHLPAIMPYVLGALGGGREGGECGRAAGACLAGLVSQARDTDAEAGVVLFNPATQQLDPAAFRSSPGRGAVFPYLGAIFTALLGGLPLASEELARMPVREGGTGQEGAARGSGSDSHAHAAFAAAAKGLAGRGGRGGGAGGAAGGSQEEGNDDDSDGDEEETDEEEGQQQQQQRKRPEDEDDFAGPGLGEDTVRKVYAHTLREVVEVYRRDGVHAFLPVLQAALTAAAAASGPQAWTLMEGAMLALSLVYPEHEDVFEDSKTCAALLPHMLALLSNPATPPYLRGTTAYTLSIMAEWLHSMQLEHDAGVSAAKAAGSPGGPGDPHLAAALALSGGVPNPMQAVFAALTTCLPSSNPTLLRRVGQAMTLLLDVDQGWSCLPTLPGALQGILSALQAAMPGAAPAPGATAPLPPALAANLRCALWTVLKGFTESANEVLEFEEGLAGIRATMAGVLASTLQRLAASDPSFSTWESEIFLDAANCFVFAAQENAVVLGGPLAAAALRMGEINLHEHERWKAEGEALAAVANGGSASPLGSPSSAGSSAGAAAASSSSSAPSTPSAALRRAAAQRLSSRPRFDFSNLIACIELLSSLLSTLTEVGGHHRSSRGLAPLTTTVRAGASTAAAAESTLAALAPTLVSPAGLFFHSLDPALASDAVTQSAYGLLGELARSPSMWAALEPVAPQFLQRGTAILSAALAGMERRSAQAQAQAQAAAASGGRGARQVHTGHIPSAHACGNILWATGMVVSQLGAEGAGAVAGIMAPTMLGLLLHTMPEQERKKSVYQNAAITLLRLCARGGQRLSLPPAALPAPCLGRQLAQGGAGRAGAPQAA